MARASFVSFAGAFLLGVFGAASDWDFLVVAGVALALGSAYSFVLNNKSFYSLEWVKIFFSLTAVIFFGFFYYHFYLNLKGENFNAPIGESAEFSGKVKGDPQFEEKFQKLEIQLVDPYRGKLVALLPLSPKFEYGDRIKFLGRIELAQEPYFDPVTYFPTAELQTKDQGSWLRAKLLDLKHSQIAVFRKFLGENEAALLSGITYGFRGDFTEEFKEKMNQSGVTHIVALSGYNIAILVLVIERTLRTFLSRRKRFILTCLLILVFVIMVGGEASVVRAAIMGFLVLLAYEAGRPYQVLRVMTLAALVMVLFNPTILKFNIGFQLSFLSLAGIVYVEPRLKRFFGQLKEKPGFLSWKENALTTISAQLVVAPILIQNFSEFSLTSIGANILVLSVVPLTMFLGFLLGFLGLVWGIFGFLLAKLAAALLFYQISVISIFSIIRLPIRGLFGSVLLLVFYYLILAYLLFLGNARQKL